MKQRRLIILCLIFVLMNLLVFSVSAETSRECGDNATWSLSDSGVLTISGTGAITDYIYQGTGVFQNEKAPWRRHAPQVKEVIVSPGITRIGDYAFCCLPNVTSVTIANTVTSIGQAAFCDMKALTQITLPDSVVDIGESLFQRCTSLTNVKLPSRLKSLPEATFKGCYELKSIELPKGLTAIEPCAFESSGLTSLVIPDGVTYIGTSAFQYCNKLTSIKLPSSLEKIHSQAFHNSAITSIVIPAKVKTIGRSFRWCQELETIRFEGNAPEIDAYAFEGVHATVYYPKDDPTWTKSVGKNYDGQLKWVSYCGNGHTWGEWKTDREATCAKEGRKIRTCTKCNMTEETSIAKTAHQYTESVIPPTCKEEGYTIHTCKGCGHQYTDNRTAVGPHVYQDEIVAPTCIQQGYTTHICTVCQHSFTDTYTETTEHAFGDWIFLKESTCLEKGSRQHSCTVCQFTQTEETDLSEHVFRDEITAPSCTKQGYTTHICTVCQYSFADTYTDITEHTYGEWTETKSASWSKEGERRRQCIACSDEQTEAIPRLPIPWGVIAGGIVIVIAASGTAIVLIKKKKSKKTTI